ncbi:hypothetical protein PMJ10TS2_66930 [Paenibacillus melissococcoides]
MDLFVGDVDANREKEVNGEGMGGEIEKSASWRETLKVRACAFEAG